MASTIVQKVDPCGGARAGAVWVTTFMHGTPELHFGGHHQSGGGVN
jgi:hypothetical protein